MPTPYGDSWIMAEAKVTKFKTCPLDAVSAQSHTSLITMCLREWHIMECCFMWCLLLQVHPESEWGETEVFPVGESVQTSSDLWKIFGKVSTCGSVHLLVPWAPMPLPLKGLICPPVHQCWCMVEAGRSTVPKTTPDTNWASCWCQRRWVVMTCCGFNWHKLEKTLDDTSVLIFKAAQVVPSKAKECITSGMAPAKCTSVSGASTFITSSAGPDTRVNVTRDSGRPPT